jgi:antitoxin HicB
MYRVELEPDDNGTLLVTCPDLPEVTTWGEDQDDALQRAADAIEEALAARIAHREPIPEPSKTPAPGRRRKLNIPIAAKPRPTPRMSALPALTVAKVVLYRAAYDAGITKAELARRLGWHAPQVDRLLDLRHRSKVEQIEQALHMLGKRLVVGVQDAA